MKSLAHPPTPDTRELRALALYRERAGDIVLVGRDTYECPSQDGERVYEVVYGGEVETCTCPDHEHRGVSCVHLLAVAVCRAKRRGTTARRLAALEDRARHEDLASDERLEVLDEILTLRRRLGR